MGKRGSCSTCLARYLEYDTPQMLHTNSKLVGVLFRSLQLVIIAFIFAYYIVYSRGYQDESNAIVSVVRLTPRPAENTESPSWSYPISLTFGQDERTFIPTYAVKLQQTRSTCIEDREIEGALCDPYNNRCKANKTLPNGNGIMTGRCISSIGTAISMSRDQRKLYYGCEINGWCTMNKTIDIVADKLNLKDMVLVVQSDVYFPKFSNERMVNNYEDTITECLKNKYLYSENQPKCPTFKLGDLLMNRTLVKGIQYKDIIETGAVVMIRILWDCNFDVNHPDDCSIKYDFRRMDSHVELLDKTPEMKFSMDFGHYGREIIFINGIRFVAKAEGTARKFNIFTFLTRTGASFGLFAIAAVACEMLLLCSCCAREKQVKDFKYINLKAQLSTRKDSQINHIV
ncbi:hypothetical protein CHUAL_007351 [Chamberlinius hualienensis]